MFVKNISNLMYIYSKVFVEQKLKVLKNAIIWPSPACEMTKTRKTHQLVV